MTAVACTSPTRSTRRGTTSSTRSCARGCCGSTATRTAGWRSTTTSSSTSTTVRVAPRERTRFACRAGIAPRRSSSDSRPHHGDSRRGVGPAARTRRSHDRDGGRDRRPASAAPVAAALMETKTRSRSAAEVALLDAAERLLVDVGYAGITTRRLAEEAGVNHGLVHYYFGSNENLMVRALERFTDRLIARQRELYAADVPFIEKWRTAMRYLVSTDVTYEKIWLELQALAWNHPELRERLARVNAEWRGVLADAFEQARREHG